MPTLARFHAMAFDDVKRLATAVEADLDHHQVAR